MVLIRVWDDTSSPWHVSPGFILLQKLLYPEVTTQERYSISVCHFYFATSDTVERDFCWGKTADKYSVYSWPSQMEVVYLTSKVLFFPFSTQAYWPFLPWADPTLLWDGHKVTNVGQAIKTSCWAKRLWLEGSSLPFCITCKLSSPFLSQHTRDDRGLLFVHVPVAQCGQSIASGYENLQWSCQRLDAGEASDTLHHV